ncbi:MAG: hypothetical protein CM15mP127_15980 [Gammaproteobacteria bacterium]|nr:MAG: hypothetical protein CM15mP127_15980 [Gammaproteobacteria bacterium]
MVETHSYTQILGPDKMRFRINFKFFSCAIFISSLVT